MLIPTQLYVGPNQEKPITKRIRRDVAVELKYGMELQRLIIVQRCFNILFKHEELTENMKHKDGFLPLIAAALAPVIGGVADGLVEREIAGSGIYKKKKTSSKKRKLRGSGMYLNPYMKKSGRGMYLNPYIKK